MESKLGRLCVKRFTSERVKQATFFLKAMERRVEQGIILGKITFWFLLLGNPVFPPCSIIFLRCIIVQLFSFSASLHCDCFFFRDRANRLSKNILAIYFRCGEESVWEGTC